MENKTENPACCPRCNKPLGPDGRCYNSKCEEYDPLSQYFDGPSEEDMKEDIRQLKERLDAERSDLDDEFVPDSEMINVWLENLFLSKGKTSPDQLTAEEIQEEIEETRVAISNERLWAHSDAIHWENVANLVAYLEELETILNNKTN